MFDRRAARLFILAQWGHNPREILEGPRGYRLLMYAFADAKLQMDEEAADPKRQQPTRPPPSTERRPFIRPMGEVIRR